MPTSLENILKPSSGLMLGSVSKKGVPYDELIKRKEGKYNSLIIGASGKQIIATGSSLRVKDSRLGKPYDAAHSSGHLVSIVVQSKHPGKRCELTFT